MVRRYWMFVFLLASSVGASSAQAQSAPPVVDEAYTFYTVDTHTFMDGATPSGEWSLKASFRAFGAISPRSVLKYAIRKGTRVLGEVRCETRDTANAVLREFYPGVFAQDCTQRDLYVRELGEVTVQWSLIDGDTDAETPLATHTIFIRRAPNFDAGSTPPRPWYPSFYVDRHGELLATVLWQRPNRSPGGREGFSRYLPNARSSRAGASIDIMFNASPEWGADDALRGSNIRCTVDGARVDLRTPYVSGPTSGHRTDEVDVRSSWSSYAQAVVPNPAGDNPRVIQDHFVFRRYYATFPLTFGPAEEQRSDATPLTPGAWECALRNDAGVTLRTFRWTVGADGRVQSHAEQAEGLSLPSDAVLIETVIPAGNGLDFRTDPASSSRVFSGRGFRTAAARAWNATIPAIGHAAPAEPGRAAASAGRGRRGH